ncbi:MAG: hypothetical protein Q4F21_14690, partial [Lachnospiraceae bacterium]|nr:hypothetical protein [Lachnospiraceae bacterium]
MFIEYGFGLKEVPLAFDKLVDIPFGLTQEQLIQLLGKPDKIIDDEEILPEPTYYYNELMTNFQFDPEEDNRLDEIDTSHPEVRLWNEKVIGKTSSEIKQLLYLHDIDSFEYEDYETMTYINNEAIAFGFEFDKVVEIVFWICYENDG